MTPPAQGDFGERAELQIFFRKVVIVFAVALTLLLLWYVRRVVILIFIAAVLAAGISPAVHRVRVFIRHALNVRIRRGTAVVLVYIPFLILAVLFAIFGLPRIVVEGADLARKLPVLLESHIIQPLSPYLPVEELRRMVAGETSEIELFTYFRGAVGVVASIIIVLVLIVYMMIDAERLRNVFLLFYPAEERGRKRRMVRRLSRRLSSWLAGQLLLALIIGVATFIGLMLLGIPYALPLALVAAIGEMIPIIGPILSAIPALVFALLQSPQHFWAVLVMAVMIQQLENHLLVPRIMGAKVSVSPLAVAIAFLIGGSLLGILGAIMAIPMTAIIQVGFEEVFVTRRERRHDRSRPGTLGSDR
ncbi:MAG TPA: AI-2E family transporter [Thermoanaerobaculia bacterium]|nr:AI-2E family transporter [Thermoanaerobaculia bacterium]